MDGSAFDALARMMARPDTRRRLLRLLTGVPVVGLLATLTREVGTDARGRKAHRHQAQHQHRHARTQRRQAQREAARSEACIPTGQRCPSKKPRGKKGKKLGCNACCQGSFVTDASGKKVCGCQPNGGACTTATATACCSGFCNGTTCQAAPCSAAVPCPQCQTCNATTGLCEAVATGNSCDDGNPCTQTDTCQAGVCVAGSPVPNGTSCGSDQVCCGGACQGCCSNTDCAGTTPVCASGTCTACTANSQCPANHLCLSDGSCHACDVVCTGAPLACGATLQAAITTGGTHYVCPGTYQPPSVAGFLPPFTGVTLIGAGDGAGPATNTVLDGNDPGRVLSINDGVVGTVVLERLRLTRGRAAGSGGAIRHLGTTLQMRDCTVTGNTSTDGFGSFGGGIATAPSRVLEMTRCTVSDNHAPDPNGKAGGIYTVGTTTLTDCLVTGNTATITGGGFYVDGGSLTLNTTLVGGATLGAANTAGSGGGIFRNAGSVTLNAGTVVCGNVPDQCVGFSDPAHCLAVCPP